MDDYKNLDIYKSFIKSELFCTKANIYFHVYEEIFQKFRNKKITFVEIGVQRGGSLLMWRDWLGPDARIIGVDLDPNAKKMEKYGFEIFIGDQSSPNFWNNFFFSCLPIKKMENKAAGGVRGHCGPAPPRQMG